MIARKRSNLDCFVAGTLESADVRAAKAAKQHMDFRTELVILDAAETARIRERLGARPGLSPQAIRSLIPLFAVLDRTEGHAWLAGFRNARVDREIVAELQRLDVRAPLVDLSARGTVPRAMLRAAAISLGLPNEWARVPHRAPAVGAGIAGFL